ncbi:hypothetical protein DPMN_142669 [Dreissena polymorpha]|uniref:Uncharacterized protein n=1 Tax=Dreissena polymorpha TaxID=45954 RepID=A0A9D4JJD0_DREPO|nr:hypothetical protein DPMN_142669 [Dreissena polymorpha]
MSVFQTVNQIHVFVIPLRMSIHVAAIQQITAHIRLDDLMKKARSTSCTATQLNIQLHPMICIVMYQVSNEESAINKLHRHSDEHSTFCNDMHCNVSGSCKEQM